MMLTKTILKFKLIFKLVFYHSLIKVRISLIKIKNKNVFIKLINNLFFEIKRIKILVMKLNKKLFFKLRSIFKYSYNFFL